MLIIFLFFFNKIIINQIAKGAHSIVKIAFKKENPLKRYAVKITRTNDPEFIKTIVEDFKILSKLHHKYIMKVYEVYVDDITKTVYYVMEYIHYPNLHNYLKKQ